MPKISNLPAAASALVTDLIPAVQGGVTKKETLQQVLNLFSGTITITEAQVTGLVADLASKLAKASNLSDLTDAAAARTNLGLAIGTNVQAYNANLQSISALGTAANKMIYTTALNTWAEADISAVGRGIVNLAAGSAGVILRSNGTNYVASTSTFADTYAINTLLYASAANTVAGLAVVNSASLVTSATGVPTWLGAMTNGQIVIGSTGAIPVLGTLAAGAGVSIANGAGTITISAGGSGFTWSEVTGTSQAMAANNGYIANNAALVTLTLPVSANIGDSYTVVGKGAGLFKIAQNAGQTIYNNSTATTTGTGGSVTATAQYNALELVCVTANNDFVLTDHEGSLTFV